MYVFINWSLEEFIIVAVINFIGIRRCFQINSHFSQMIIFDSKLIFVVYFYTNMNKYVFCN